MSYTDLKNNFEEKIRENKGRFGLIMDNIKDYAIITLDENGIIKNWNKAAEQLKGYKKEEIIGKHFSVFYKKEDIEKKEPEKNLELTRMQGRYEREGWRVKKDGSLFMADIIFSPLYNKDGDLNGYIKVTRDITERKKAEETLRISEKQLKEAQKIAKLGSWVWNVINDDVIWSEEMYYIFEVKHEKTMTYQKYLELLGEENKIQRQQAIDEAIKNGTSFHYYLNYKTPSGRNKILSSRGEIEKEPGGKIIRMVGTVMDITRIKMVEEELRETNERLIIMQKELIHNEKLAALGRFSSGIAHEIRNPLANISALAQLVSKAKIDDEKMKKHLKYILVNSDIANNIIKDLLHFASPDDLVLEQISIRDIVENVVNSIEARCLENKIVLTKQIGSDIPEIQADKVKIENALLNFISNAIEAMPVGGNLSVKTYLDKTHNDIVIDIIDTGQGIPAENIDKIFEPFFTTKASGTGLGLGLAYQTIKSHSGILNIISEPGKGTNVIIKLPIKNNN
ncbi:MAG: PAS domain S-box protein [Ignavibacteria bacterium]|nr:PAS domain S-box protein [Ignavibacteria bacterium]